MPQQEFWDDNEVLYIIVINDPSDWWMWWWLAWNDGYGGGGGQRYEAHSILSCCEIPRRKVLVETERQNFTRMNIGDFFDGYKEHNMAMMVNDTKVLFIITSRIIIITANSIITIITMMVSS